MNCLQCESTWHSRYQDSLTNCPFCRALLPNLNSINGTILVLVDKYTPEIYNDIVGFNTIITDLFHDNEELCRLLKTIVTLGGSAEVYKIRNAKDKEFQQKRDILLEEFSKNTFIPQNILAPAIDLLCFGLGKGSAPEITAEPTAPPSPVSDFEIRDGFLSRYIGNDKDVVIPSNVTFIGGNAFNGANSLKSIQIPNNVTSIGDATFFDCNNLTSVTISSFVSSIGGYAFSRCINLNTIKIPKSVTSINQNCFQNCTSLSTIDLPNTLTSIGGLAFNNCTSLSLINIPETLTFIYYDAFLGCSSLPQSTKDKLLKINPNCKF